jgi:lipopolysaccharide/colanic/teichoic acid biosynthesis glycosyltransferase
LDEAGEALSPLGERLRAAAMDELPQLINILRGQMSFVGPRPLIPDELRELSRLPGGTRRLEIRPGLTGLAQLHADKAPSLEQRLGWDLAYVDRCSFGLDLRILLKSVGVSLGGRWEQPGPKADPPEA